MRIVCFLLILDGLLLDCSWVYLTKRFLLCSCKLDNGICVSSSFVMLKAWDVGY